MIELECHEKNETWIVFFFLAFSIVVQGNFHYLISIFNGFCNPSNHAGQYGASSGSDIDVNFTLLQNWLRLGT